MFVFKVQFNQLFFVSFIVLIDSKFQNGVTYRIRHYNNNMYLSRNLDQDAVSFKQWKNDNRFKYLATSNYTSQFVLSSLERGSNGEIYVLDEHAYLHYLQTYIKHDGPNQRWTIEPVKENAFLIRNEYSKKCIMFGVEVPHLLRDCKKEDVLFWWIIEESY